MKYRASGQNEQCTLITLIIGFLLHNGDWYIIELVQSILFTNLSEILNLIMYKLLLVLVFNSGRRIFE